MAVRKKPKVLSTLGLIIYLYRGNCWQMEATVALTSAVVPSKSRAVLPMHWAMTYISSLPKPRVVTAGVPMRTPLVTEGF